MKINYVNGQENTIPEVQEAIDKLEELKSEPRSPEYYEMQQKHSDELKQIADFTKPWDWSFSMEFMIEHLRWMRDYYTLGENVMAMERKDEDPKRYKNYPTRLQTIEKAIYYYNKWHTVEEEYIQIIQHPETYKAHENDDGTVTIDDLGFHCVYKYRSVKKTYKKLHKAEEKYKKLFFDTIRKYMEEWWD